VFYFIKKRFFGFYSIFRTKVVIIYSIRWNVCKLLGFDFLINIECIWKKIKHQRIITQVVKSPLLSFTLTYIFCHSHQNKKEIFLKIFLFQQSSRNFRNIKNKNLNYEGFMDILSNKKLNSMGAKTFIHKFIQKIKYVKFFHFSTKHQFWV
jgi:hypothetical protein